MDGEFVTIILIVIGAAASILGILGAGFALGKYYTKKEITQQQQPQPEDLAIKEAIKRFQWQIKWIDDMTTELNYRINMGKLSRQEEAVYRDWIAELDIHKRVLERSLDDISEKKPKGSG
jgi:hypothetical protein